MVKILLGHQTSNEFNNF